MMQALQDFVFEKLKRQSLSLRGTCFFAYRVRDSFSRTHHEKYFSRNYIPEGEDESAQFILGVLSGRNAESTDAISFPCPTQAHGSFALHLQAPRSESADPPAHLKEPVQLLQTYPPAERLRFATCFRCASRCRGVERSTRSGGE